MNNIEYEDPLAPARGIISAFLLTLDAAIVIWIVIQLVR